MDNEEFLYFFFFYLSKMITQFFFFCQHIFLNFSMTKCTISLLFKESWKKVLIVPTLNKKLFWAFSEAKYFYWNSKAEHTSNIKEPMPYHRRENILNETVVDGLPNTHPTHMVEIVLLKIKLTQKKNINLRYTWMEKKNWK